MSDLSTSIELRNLRQQAFDLGVTTRKLFFDRENAISDNANLKKLIVKLAGQLNRTKHVVITADWRAEIEALLEQTTEALKPKWVPATLESKNLK